MEVYKKIQVRHHTFLKKRDELLGFFTYTSHFHVKEPVQGCLQSWFVMNLLCFFRIPPFSIRKHTSAAKSVQYLCMCWRVKYQSVMYSPKTRKIHPRLWCNSSKIKKIQPWLWCIAKNETNTSTSVMYNKRMRKLHHTKVRYTKKSTRNHTYL